MGFAVLAFTLRPLKETAIVASYRISPAEHSIVPKAMHDVQ